MVHDRARSAQAIHSVSTTSVMHIVGEVDAASAPAIGRQARRVCWSAPQTLLVDLTGVTFFAAAGLSLLVDIHRQTQLTETALYLIAPPRVMRLLRITGLAKMFRTQDRAVAAEIPAAGAGRPPVTPAPPSDADAGKGLLRLVSD